MKNFCLEVRGDYACFTRPETKAERVSYEVITPSAARAIFEAVLWKPAIQWRIDRIEILQPVQWLNVRRNEVGVKIPTRSVEAAMRAGRGSLGLYVEQERQQRAGLILRDVAYRLHAVLAVSAQNGSGNNLAKYADMFRRRARRGQCINQPYLGCREFDARVRLVESAHDEPQPLEETRDLGLMLYDLDFTDPAHPLPLFFHARINRGVMDVPGFESPRVLR